ncbi:hypothetical protein GTQ40_15625 [Flavobacteriaceae bacterium R38]|nr:hypothetical protein [Flavobacteriaceae bacterium R38]
MILTSCAKKQDPFAISKGQVGKLSRDTAIEQLDSIYKEDSLVIIKGNSNFRYSRTDQYAVYEKGGEHLLTIDSSTDSIPLVENIQVFDNRFKTAKGISLASTFKDISSQYKISKIERVLGNVVVFINEIDVYVTIDKGELPPDLRFNNNKIEAVNIPDDAKIKYFMIGWD